MNRDFDLRTERTHIGLWTYFHNGSRFQVFQNQEFQVLDAPFTIHPGVILPEDSYSFNNMVVQYFHNPSSSLFGNIRYSWGDFWSGTIRGLNYGVTVRVKPRFFVQVGHQKNWIKLPEGDFTTDLASLRLQYSFTTKQFLDTFVQYNNRGNVLSLQVRYNLIHRPLSDLFVVFHEQRADLLEDQARSLAIKFTQLFDF